MAAILSILTALAAGAAGAAAPEIRGTSITTTSSDDWSAANLQTTMNSLKQVGLNTVYVEAWKNGYTNFTSPTLAAFTGTTSLNPTVGGRTLLNETRTAAANAGLIHGAWFEYGAMAQYLGNTGTATGSFNPLARRCRDATWTVGTTSGTGWLLKDSSGNYTTSSNGFVWMNPLVPEVRNLLKGIVVDAINQFDLQIVQFDDHLAWPVQFGWDDYTKAVYKQETNRNLPSNSSDATFLSWRQGKTQALFAEIADAARAAKPSVVVSLAPSTASFAAANYCANWPNWLDKTDEVLPQVYRSTYASFATDWAAQITASGTYRPELGAGLRLLGTGSATPWSELQQQIDRTRTDAALGHFIWYSEGVSNSGTSNASNYNAQLTAYYDVATNGPAANPLFTSVRWSGTTGTGGSGTWSTLSATWKDRSTIWVQDALGIFDGVGGTVTASGTVGVAGGLDFRTTGYTVTGGTMALRGHTRAANAIAVATDGTATLASTLTGSTGLTKSGAGVLALAGTGTGLTGGVAVDAGTLRLETGGTTGSLNAAIGITVAAGGTMAFNRSDAYGGAIANVISGSGSVRVESGSLTMSALNTYSGTTLVLANSTLTVTGRLSNGALTVASGGTLLGSGTILGAATIQGVHRPATSSGTQTFSSLAYAAGGTLAVAGLDSRVVAQSTVAIDPAAGFIMTGSGASYPSSGASLVTLVLGQSLTGTFGTVTLPASPDPDGIRLFSALYENAAPDGEGMMNAFKVGLAAPGDIDYSGDVSPDDILSLAANGLFNSGGAASWRQGDFNQDGVFSSDDILMAAATGVFNSGPYAVAAAAPSWSGERTGELAVVPEPSLTAALGLVTLAAAASGLRRTRIVGLSAGRRRPLR